MARGGRRAGKPGTAYGQRTDLNQPVVASPSKVYGDSAASVEQQRAMPLAQAPAGPVMRSPAGGPLVQPGGLFAPSGRPEEPVHAGMPIGPGGGPDFAQLTDRDLIEAIARMYPSSGIMSLLERSDAAV